MHYGAITWLLHHWPNCPVHTKPSTPVFNLFRVKGSAPKGPAIQVVLCGEITRSPQREYTHTHTHRGVHTIDSTHIPVTCMKETIELRLVK